jgi:hypothetical protein
MIKTHTFNDIENRYTFTVLKRFLQRCPSPEKLKMEDLYNDHGLWAYFHNETGPALIRHLDNKQEHYICGHKKEGLTQDEIDLKIKLES